MFGAKLIGFAAAVAVGVAADKDHLVVHPEDIVQIFKQGPTTAGCTHTVFTNHPFNIGPTKTEYTKTFTTTDGVNCGPCHKVVATPFPDGPGPVAIFTTTITAATPTTVSSFYCAATATTTAPAKHPKKKKQHKDDKDCKDDKKDHCNSE
ncbi:hypothetical protein E4U42_004836 [Claviceps africana]|uniref:Uncharacterized protein n=1 Tax=Claviceps africana TaxID=83212 RepID=A0A8K0J4Q8_9HYPO|nr:hypothetical protein E4U42_004836 [Claviceps africana]